MTFLRPDPQLVLVLRISPGSERCVSCFTREDCILHIQKQPQHTHSNHTQQENTKATTCGIHAAQVGQPQAHLLLLCLTPSVLMRRLRALSYAWHSVLCSASYGKVCTRRITHGC
jgi:hypothetical protein